MDNNHIFGYCGFCGGPMSKNREGRVVCNRFGCAPYASAPDIAPDNVNHPEHYTSGGIECIDAIKAALTPEEFRGFLKGNVMKYTWRERMKGGDESLRKAAWYLERLING